MLDDEQTAQAVRAVISLGYRHIDTAQIYMNEAGVGKAILSCGVAIKELFITTKVAAEVKNYDAVTQSIHESLAKLVNQCKRTRTYTFCNPRLARIFYYGFSQLSA